MHDSKGTGTMPSLPEATMHGLREPARVLVADNDPITGRLLFSIGEKDGYEVVTVADGREAYRMLKSERAFNAVVFDIALPDVGGVEIVRYMKTEKRLMHIPIMILAGEGGLKLISECFSAGAIAFLPKPFTTEQLRRTVRMAISSQPSKIFGVPPLGGS
jgi:CheY-like chemotaxis protein